MSGVVVLALRLISTAALYSFLGWVLYLLWMDLRHQSFQLNNQKPGSIKLNIKFNEQTIVQRFNNKEIFIGRDPDCECSLPDESTSIQHARIAHHHKQWWIEDLNSTNGTKLNDTLVMTPTVIMSGDRIQCGQTQIVIELD